jgi:hypothetical protein
MEDRKYPISLESGFFCDIRITKKEMEMWDYEGLYEKSTTYARRGHDLMTSEQDQALLWLIMGYELLLRSALSKIHKSLLVESKEESSLLFANGINTEKSPRSAGATTLLSRAQFAVKDFSKKDSEISTAWFNYRNEEVHTSVLAMSNMDKDKFIPEYYILSEKLLRHIGKNLIDYFGKMDGESASRIISSFREDKRREVNALIEVKKKEFHALSIEARLKLIQESHKFNFKFFRIGSKNDVCPACEGNGYIYGELARIGPVKADEEGLSQDHTYSPVEFRCAACGLHLKGMDLMVAMGKSKQYVQRIEIDPADYYNIPVEQDGPEYQDE